ncbi:MAG TPA: hypothetical protein VLG47_06480 [Candidatus Saccharimonadales bacterium]|nr:hypothetical protein [Candidatus Saccharimonadales bacterium]
MAFEELGLTNAELMAFWEDQMLQLGTPIFPHALTTALKPYIAHENPAMFMAPMIDHSIKVSMGALSVLLAQDRLPTEVTDRAELAENMAQRIIFSGIHRRIFHQIYLNDPVLRNDFPDYMRNFNNDTFTRTFSSVPINEVSRVAGSALLLATAAANGELEDDTSAGPFENIEASKIPAETGRVLGRSFHLQETVSKFDSLKKDRIYFVAGTPYYSPELLEILPNTVDSTDRTTFDFTDNALDALAKFILTDGCPMIRVKPKNDLKGNLYRQHFALITRRLLMRGATANHPITMPEIRR